MNDATRANCCREGVEMARRSLARGEIVENAFDGWKCRWMALPSLFSFFFFVNSPLRYLEFLWFASSGSFPRLENVSRPFANYSLLFFVFSSFLCVCVQFLEQFIPPAITVDGRTRRSRGTISLGNLLELNSSKIQ